MSKNLHIYGETPPQIAIDRTLTSVNVEVNENEQEITPQEGFNGFNKVNVKAAKLQEKIITPSNETQEVVADEGYYGLSKVIVCVSPVGNEIINNVNSKVDKLSETLFETYAGGDAISEDIIKDKIAYVKGEKIVGTYKPQLVQINEEENIIATEESPNMVIKDNKIYVKVGTNYE